MLNILSAPKLVCKNSEINTKKIVKYLKSEKVEYSVYFSNDLEMFKSVVESLSNNGETEFVIVGGDEAISCFVNSVYDITKVKFGIVPTSADDNFASYLNLSFSPTQAIKDICKKNIEQVDLMLVNDKKVINNVFIGASAEIFEIYNQYKLKNYFTKKFANIKYKNNFTGVEIGLMGNGVKSKKITIFDMVISNTGSALGNNINPLCNVSDGLINVNYTLQENKTKLPFMFNNSKLIYDEQIAQLWLNNLKITTDGVKVVIDEKLEKVENLVITTIEKALKIYK